MERKFRITYVRTAYSEIDVAAEDCHEAEELFEAMATAFPEMLDQSPALITPRYRIVDVVALDQQQPTATSKVTRIVAVPDLVEPAA